MKRIQIGQTVKVLSPDYVAGATGIVLQQETLNNGSQTGYWLVQLKDHDAILALLPQEIGMLD